MYAVYTAALTALLAGYAPVAAYRRLAHGVPLNLRARLGADLPSAGRPCGWIHAVSVGEAVAAGPLLQAIHRAHPELPLVVSTVTPTGAGIVRERYAGLARHAFFPLDLPWAVRRAMDALDPAFLILMETELWPNALREAARRGVPVMIVNGRLSDRSYRRYRRAARWLRAVLDDVRVFAMQSDEDARRVIGLGARPDRVVVTGNLKHDAPVEAGEAQTWRRLLGLAPEQLLWVAGSTHAGEEREVLEAHAAALARHPGLALVIAPRHPERVAEVADLVAARGFSPVRRSALGPLGTAPSADRPGGAAPDARAPVVMLDTVGELARLYAAADVVFVGGSLVPSGGHNVLEPALRAKPVLFGPHTTNFREAAALLAGAGGGLVVADGRALAAALVRLLDDPAERAERGQAACAAAASRHGALEATLALVERHLLNGRRAPAAP